MEKGGEKVYIKQGKMIKTKGVEDKCMKNFTAC